MTVYVDDAQIPARVRQHDSTWCHLTADSQDELHAFAAALGLKRSYFQPGTPLGGKPSPFWHYDVTAGKRQQALARGAQPVSARDMPRICREREARAVEATDVVIPNNLATRLTQAGGADNGNCLKPAAEAAQAREGVTKSDGRQPDPMASVALDADAADLEAGHAYRLGDFARAASLIRDARELAPGRDQHWTARQERIQQAAAALGLRAQTAARLAAAGIGAEDEGLQQVARHNAEAQRAAQLGREAGQ